MLKYEIEYMYTFTNYYNNYFYFLIIKQINQSTKKVIFAVETVINLKERFN